VRNSTRDSQDSTRGEERERESVAHKTVLDRFRLDGKVALITGGARGLGQVMATALAEAGANIALAGRSKAACEAAADTVASATGRTVKAYAADVTRADQVERLAADIAADLGQVDILINNAGINIRGPIQKLSEADWDAVIDTNLKGPWLCCRAFGPAMVERRWGRVINMASILAVIAMPDRTPYASSKAGVLNMSKVLALEWAGTGVTVNAICPGVFGTEMNRPLMDDVEKYKAFVAQIPMGRWGEVEELAGAAVFLASDASSYVTGSALFVDGGWTAR
jgi:NAD(P)-dependent dehydrogenase (short-subunit alcohol dehydrogenase family)